MVSCTRLVVFLILRHLHLTSAQFEYRMLADDDFGIQVYDDSTYHNPKLSIQNCQPTNQFIYKKLFKSNFDFNVQHWVFDAVTCGNTFFESHSPEKAVCQLEKDLKRQSPKWFEDNKNLIIIANVALMRVDRARIFEKVNLTMHFQHGNDKMKSFNLVTSHTYDRTLTGFYEISKEYGAYEEDILNMLKEEKYPLCIYYVYELDPMYERKKLVFYYYYCYDKIPKRLSDFKLKRCPNLTPGTYVTPVLSVETIEVGDDVIENSRTVMPRRYPSACGLFFQSGLTCSDKEDCMYDKCVCKNGLADCNIQVDVCASGANRCSDYGTCIFKSSDNTYSCECEKHAKGKYCYEEVNYCESKPCKNNANCMHFLKGFKCICKPPYTGTLCADKINFCLTTICQNGGTCVSKFDRAECTCPKGFTGKFCDVRDKQCQDLNCGQYGTCQLIDHVPKCVCNAYYEGANCDKKVDFCKSKPCVKGSCSNLDTGYECKCQPGYEGKDCSEEINECRDQPCGDDGYCIDKLNGYTCLCYEGYGEKDQCLPPKDHCSKNPCKHGGTCSNNRKGFTCNCATHYAGKYCEKFVDYCSGRQICAKGSTCIVVQGGFQCLCQAEHTGPTCSEKINLCQRIQCKHGGRCETIEGNRYVCNCPEDTSGKHCEYKNGANAHLASKLILLIALYFVAHVYRLST